MRFALFVVIVLLRSCVALGEDGNAGTHGEFLAALRANYSTISSFDVTLAQESLKLQGEPFGCEGCERIVLDLENSRALVLKNMTYMNMESGAEEVVLESTLVVGNDMWIHHFPNPQIRRTKPFEQALDTLDVFDPMQIGLLPFPQKFRADGQLRANQWDLLIGSANQYGSSQQDADHAKIVVRLAQRASNQPEVKFSPQFTYVFDLAALTPKSLSTGTLVEYNGDERPFKPKTQESYTWKDVDGIMLPTRLSSTKRVSLQRDGEIETDNQNVETRFRWRSVNKPIPDEMWDPSKWSELDEIRRACVLEDSKRTK